MDMSSTAAHVGTGLFLDGASTADVSDGNGNTFSESEPTNGAWIHRVFDLSTGAGGTNPRLVLAFQHTTPTGTADAWFKDIALVRADGSTLPIFTGGSASLTDFNGMSSNPNPASDCGGFNLLHKVETTALLAEEGTSYYLDDHLGTKQMELSAGGWPIWEGQFAPFGQEFDNQTTAMRYKFTGKERDAESGLDYFGARYFGSSMGRFMSPDWSAKAQPVPYAKLDDPQTLNLYAYVGNNPLNRFDADGHCADHYKDGSCKVNVDPATGKAGTLAGKQLEGILNKYDKAVNALDDKGKFNIKDKDGKVIGSMTGQEMKAVWNGTSFTVTNNKDFQNGGVGGGTAGTWTGTSFSGHSELNADLIKSYGNSAGQVFNEPWRVGFATLIFHELSHETHFGDMLTRQYPVTQDLAWPREWGTSSAGNRWSSAVGASFDCRIPGGCQ